jgi:hypothetical protein
MLIDVKRLDDNLCARQSALQRSRMAIASQKENHTNVTRKNLPVPTLQFATLEIEP